ncbi:hypothetical protein SAMN05880561_10372 [Rhizobium sp. RU33A]|uniref:hypothetical protein n=1 Tax=Rhizobium sp. RU33A TaxID=1907413 RepID=UPI000953C5CB|nr:hypothetical protein [Rhizobium sp. RU33A]SIQ46495.1 hypothetical protein SAMN05880561_10372 [Rhizobium sp. RU33A]
MAFASIMHITRAIEAVGVAVIVIGIAVSGFAYLKSPRGLDAFGLRRGGSQCQRAWAACERLPRDDLRCLRSSSFSMIVFRDCVQVYPSCRTGM